MALIKIGTDFFKGRETPVYLMAGTATRDAETRAAGSNALASVGIAAVKKKDGTTVYVNLNGWRNHVREVAAVRKLDSIIAVGTLKEREYNGKKYYDLDADFVCRSGAGLTVGGEAGDLPGVFPAGAPVDVGAEDFNDGFAEIEEDGELPF